MTGSGVGGTSDTPGDLVMELTSGFEVDFVELTQSYEWQGALLNQAQEAGAALLFISTSV